jgi:hypothetical protein
MLSAASAAASYSTAMGMIQDGAKGGGRGGAVGTLVSQRSQTNNKLTHFPFPLGGEQGTSLLMV